MTWPGSELEGERVRERGHYVWVVECWSLLFLVWRPWPTIIVGVCRASLVSREYQRRCLIGSVHSCSIQCHFILYEREKRARTVHSVSLRCTGTVHA